MKFIQTIFFGLAIILTSSCSKEKNDHEKIFSAGVIKDGVFSHESTGISMDIPNDWETSNFSTIKKAQRSAAKDVIKEDPEYTSSNINGAYPLLAISKYPLNKPTRHLHNPTLSITATSKEVLSGLGIDSLEEKMNLLTDVQPPFFVIGSGTPVACGNTKGLYAHIEVRHPQGTIRQDVVQMETEQFIIDAVVSTTNPDDRKTLMNTLNTITLK